MTDDSMFFSAIAAGDMKAAEVFTTRFSALLFRYCRLNFTDHFRTSEFVEQMFAVWINRIRRSGSGIPDVCELFEEANRLSSGQWKGSRGRGLSGKQRRILELMENIPLKDRLALDFVLLEQQNSADVAQWLNCDSAVIDGVITAFLDTLSHDERIRELLEHAAIHQSRQRRREAAGESASRSFESGRRPKETGRVPESRDQRFKTFSKPLRTRPNEAVSLEKTARPDHTTAETCQDTGGTATGRRPSTDNEHQKPGPRRRRVDPREIDFDI